MQLKFRKMTPFRHALPITDIQANFGINVSDIKLPRNLDIDTDERTERQTDGHTDVATIGNFFRKKMLKTNACEASELSQISLL